MAAVKRYFIAVLLALVFNIIWEFSHYHLYVDLSGIQKYPHLIIASFADMLIISGIFLVTSLKNKSFNWLKSPSRGDYLLVVFLGLAVAIFIEIINLHLGRWSYTSAMPVILGVGLSPVVQLVVTGIISLVLTARWKSGE